MTEELVHTCQPTDLRTYRPAVDVHLHVHIDATSMIPSYQSTYRHVDVDVDDVQHFPLRTDKKRQTSSLIATGGHHKTTKTIKK